MAHLLRVDCFQFLRQQGPEAEAGQLVHQGTIQGCLVSGFLAVGVPPQRYRLRAHQRAQCDCKILIQSEAYG